EFGQSLLPAAQRWKHGVDQRALDVKDDGPQGAWKQRVDSLPPDRAFHRRPAKHLQLRDGRLARTRAHAGGRRGWWMRWSQHGLHTRWPERPAARKVPDSRGCRNFKSAALALRAIPATATCNMG